MYSNYISEVKNIKVIVVDDEMFGREQIKLLITKYFPQITLVAEAANSAEALKQIYFHKPDLIFLDVEMPDSNGFDLLEKIQEHDFEIIFVTAFDQYAIKAIKFSALDYLLKPLNKEEFKSAVQKFLDRQKSEYDRKSVINNFIRNIKSEEDKLFRLAVNTSNKTYFLLPDEIIRCEADGNYTKITCGNKEVILSSKTLKEFDDLLNSYNFIRVHRAHLVNIKYIRSFENENKLVLSDNSAIEVSRRKIAEVRNLFGQ